MSWHPDQSRAFLGYHVRDPDQHCPGSLPVPTVRMFCSYVAFPFEPNLDEIAQFYEDDRNLFVGSLADCLPPPDVITKTHPANYASTKFDFSSLVDLRSAHETRQVKNYSRTPQINTPESASQKQEILRAFNAVLRRNKEKRLGSGLHWQQQYGSSSGTSGDSVSAELAATVRASKVRFTPVCSLRNVFALAHFKAAKVRHKGFSRVVLPKPHGGILKDAGVTHLRVLRCLENPSGPFNESSWASVSVAKKIYVARGMSRHTDELDCSHMDCIVDSPALVSKKAVARVVGMVGFFPLPTSTACRTSAFSFSNTPTSTCSVQSTRPIFNSRPGATTLYQHASFSLSFRKRRLHWGEILKSVRTVPFIGSSRRRLAKLSSRSSI